MRVLLPGLLQVFCIMAGLFTPPDKSVLLAAFLANVCGVVSWSLQRAKSDIQCMDIRALQGKGNVGQAFESLRNTVLAGRSIHIQTPVKYRNLLPVPILLLLSRQPIKQLPALDTGRYWRFPAMSRKYGERSQKVNVRPVADLKLKGIT